MSKEYSGTVPHWYAIHTKPHQEERANNNLTAWGVETFAPKVRVQQYNKYSGKSSYIIKPLFTQYIFARFKADELLHKIWFTRGVYSVISFGDKPCPVEDEIIRLIQARRSEEGFIRMVDEFNPGDKVTISHGYLKDFVGIFERTMKDNERIAILLTAVNYQIHVVMEKEFVRKANNI